MNQTPEQIEKLKQHAAACLAAAEGKPWQYRTMSGDWRDGRHDSSPLHIGNLCRPKPEPAVKPWTLDTAPLLKVRRKSDGEVVRIESFGCSIVSIRESLTTIPYTILAHDYEQLDGSPCGTVE